MSKKTLIEALNEDLAAEWGTVIRYTYHASKLAGPGGMVLSEFYRDEAQDELGHATFLSQIIADLGGNPTTEPEDFPRLETVDEMLAYDLEQEQSALENYKKHAELASELGHIELQVKLEDMAADESGHARELQRLMKGLPSTEVS